MKTSALLFLLFLLPACTALTKTSEFYYKHINPSPTISLDNKGLANGIEYQFSKAIMPVDRPFSSLLETITARDRFPETATLQKILRYYPWLESIGVFDPAGKMLEHVGQDFQLTSENLLSIKNPEERKPRLIQDQAGLFVLLYPVYINNIWSGFKAACFHPDKLMYQSSQADQLALFLEGTPVFCGSSFPAPETMVHELQTNDAIHGEFKLNGIQYRWLRRNIGGRWLVYAYFQKD